MISPTGETKLNNAFTLIEILLVLVIVGIILALSGVNLSKGYTRFQLNQTVNDLLDCSRWAQSMAIGQERVYALFFSDDRRYYSLERATEDQNDFEPVHGALGRKHSIPDSIGLVISQPDNSKGTGPPDGESGNMERIEFYPDGTIDPTTIQLSSPGQKTEISSAVVRGMMMQVDHE